MSLKKILIADDEARMRKLVRDFLQKEKFMVVEAANGQQALDIFLEENAKIDLILLDVMMPLIDGWTVCREIRKTSKVPIIMLTARGEESDELFGFGLGADEYIAKPFSLKILAARIDALLRRLENGAEMKSFAGLEIDAQARYVYLNGTSIEMSPKEYELLLYLTQNAGRALSRDQILDAVWDMNFFGDVRTVDTHIKKLRLKLGEKGEYIQTVRGHGYRFEVAK